MCDGRGNVATAAHGELEGLAPTGMNEAGAVVRHQRASTLVGLAIADDFSLQYDFQRRFRSSRRASSFRSSGFPRPPLLLISLSSSPFPGTAQSVSVTPAQPRPAVFSLALRARRLYGCCRPATASSSPSPVVSVSDHGGRKRHFGNTWHNAPIAALASRFSTWPG
ncbi:hypothetical protein BJV77DRAFT_958615 [Russula vinacea]|nr:hypothetical protein BJV77DRAFT_958615 [Russula vinacea]